MPYTAQGASSSLILVPTADPCRHPEWSPTDECELRRFAIDLGPRPAFVPDGACWFDATAGRAALLRAQEPLIAEALTAQMDDGDARAVADDVLGLVDHYGQRLELDGSEQSLAAAADHGAWPDVSKELNDIDPAGFADWLGDLEQLGGWLLYCADFADGVRPVSTELRSC